MKRIKSFLPFFLLLLLLVLLPVLFFKALEMKTVADYLTNTLNIEKKELIAVFTNFLTGIVTVTLAAVVFYQNKGINDLKSTILGTTVEDIQLDYSVDNERTDYIFNISFDKSPLTISQSVSDQSHELWFRLKIGENTSKDMVFPIVIKTKSTHTVTELKLKKINFHLFNNSEKNEKETIRIPKVSIKKRFQECDQILLFMGLTINEYLKPEKIETTYYFQFIHLNGYKQLMKIHVKLESISNNDSKFYITSYSTD